MPCVKTSACFPEPILHFGTEEGYGILCAVCNLTTAKTGGQFLMLALIICRRRNFMVFLISWLLQSWCKLKYYYFFSVLVLCTQVNYDLCDVTLIVYPHLASLKTVARHIFQAYPVWIYTQSNITNIKYYCWHTLVWCQSLSPPYNVGLDMHFAKLSPNQ
jgi:hypothetical protein